MTTPLIIADAGPRYKCCDHCGDNFPEVGQSMCDKLKDNHTVPCNEVTIRHGVAIFCEKGTEVAD